MFITDPVLDCLPIPNPGSRDQNALDPGSATLFASLEKYSNVLLEEGTVKV
jgi:hypothetical protein